MLRTLLKPLSFVPALLMMYMIYSFSAQPASESSALSYKVSYTIVKTADRILDADLEEWQIQDYAVRYHHVTRKIAHMSEYFLLAVAVAFPLYVYGLHGILLMILVGVICVGFAFGDEYHQSFVAGRGPSLKDVAIDSFGVFWGIILVRIVGWTGRHTIFRPRKNREQHVSRKELREIRRQQQEIYEAQQQMERRQQREEYIERMEERREERRKKREERDRYDSIPPEQFEDYTDEPDEPSADTLSEDMPFSKFLRKH